LLPGDTAIRTDGEAAVRGALGGRFFVDGPGRGGVASAEGGPPCSSAQHPCYRAGPYYDARRPCYGAHDPCSSALPATITRSVARGRAMTEAEWLACTDPTPMLEYLRGPVTRDVEVHFGRQILFERYLDRRITDRKLRLFACACCRRIALVFTPE